MSGSVFAVAAVSQVSAIAAQCAVRPTQCVCRHTPLLPRAPRRGSGIVLPLKCYLEQGRWLALLQCCPSGLCRSTIAVSCSVGRTQPPRQLRSLQQVGLVECAVQSKAGRTVPVRSPKQKQSWSIRRPKLWACRTKNGCGVKPAAPMGRQRAVRAPAKIRRPRCTVGKPSMVRKNSGPRSPQWPAAPQRLYNYQAVSGCSGEEGRHIQ